MITPPKPMIRVWDPVVRLFHWTLVASFFGADLLSDFRNVHKALGYVALGAVAVRLVWGFVGSSHARFADFVPGPRRFFGYVRDMVRGREERFVGHNPAGGAMVVALLAMVVLLGVTGWMMGLDRFWGAAWLEELHDSAASLALALVAFHIGGVLWVSRRHDENLLVSMLTGRKRS